MKFDVIIIGTGPAGVSAAFPLVEAGLEVLMLDAGADDLPNPPQGDYLSLRQHDRQQWDWMIGRDFRPLRFAGATTPKLRVPSLAATFDQFNELNGISTDNFTCAGSLASGGLSNAWGAGVARFDAQEFASFPVSPREFDTAYASVARRIGVSGRNDDDLKDYFGLDHVAEPTIALEANCATLLDRYQRRRTRGADTGLRLGRTRLALLVDDRDGRQACDQSGLCLWGCHRRAIYSARFDLEALKKRPNLKHRTGLVVERLHRSGSEWIVKASARGTGSAEEISARSVVLAAGTVATSAIALRSLERINQPLRLLSGPTAAFLLVLPERIGRNVERTHNMSQLSASIEGVSQFGNIHCGLFAAAYIPAREFVTHLPLSAPMAIRLWRMLAPAALAGNCFLPGDHTNHTITLRPDGGIAIHGGTDPALNDTLKKLHRRLTRAFARLGAFIPPGGFLAGSPGSDIHYAGTLPMMREGPVGTTRPDGELAGLQDVYVADAACLPTLPAKPHTLTMMANAHRIGTALAKAALARRISGDSSPPLR